MFVAIIFVLVTIISNVLAAETITEMDCLKVHNEQRDKHGVPRLKTSKKLVDIAARRAMYIASSGDFSHSNKPDDVGENLYYKTVPTWLLRSEAALCSRAVQYWYKESNDYDYGRGQPKPGKTFAHIGHLTQLLWRDTTEVGCAQSQNGSKVTVVCNYTPPGNVKGKFVENVPPAKYYRSDYDDDVDVFEFDGDY